MGTSIFPLLRQHKIFTVWGQNSRWSLSITSSDIRILLLGALGSYLASHALKASTLSQCLSFRVRNTETISPQGVTQARMWAKHSLDQRLILLSLPSMSVACFKTMTFSRMFAHLQNTFTRVKQVFVSTVCYAARTKNYPFFLLNSWRSL